VLIAVLVIGALMFTASRISTSDFAITPGDAEPVGPLITIAGHSSQGHGAILLTDVYLTQLTWLTYLPAWLNSTTDIVPQDELVEPGISVSELDAQGYLEMAQAKQSAQVAALTRLGYQVGATPDGAVITGVGQSSPASGRLSVADIVVGVDGQPTTSACAVIRATHSLPAGTTANLQVRQATIESNGVIKNGAPVTEKVTLGTPPSTVGSSPCPGVSGPERGYLGIELQDDTAYTFPIKITISTPNIGGPSAGLAMTLGIIDQLSHGTLLHHQTIAATGTMAPDGTVGDVGGVRQKSVAVSKAGATLFFVPTVERSAAQSTAASTMKVDPVASLNKALDVLFAKGGSITLVNGTTESQADASAGS
jgi:PDZ domain-containing protein